MKTLAIMQPYFLPYIGYFQLIASADMFIVYDNIKYTKRGWINRNRLLQNGKGAVFSLPLKGDSDALDVVQRQLADDFDRNRLLNRFKGAYRGAPYFRQTIPLIEKIMQYEDANLFRFVHHAIVKTCEHLCIDTEIVVSSKIAIDNSLKGQDKVLALCEAVGATTYVNAIGGVGLYSADVFRNRNIELRFIRSMPLNYSQLGNEFVPWLSIIDVMMFLPMSNIRQYIANGYELI